MAVANLGQLVSEMWEFVVTMGLGGPMQRKAYRGIEYVWMWNYRTSTEGWRKL